MCNHLLKVQMISEISLNVFIHVMENYVYYYYSMFYHQPLSKYFKMSSQL